MSHGPAHVPEHDFEPQPGLPEPLPRDETLLWQGAPVRISVHVPA